MIAPPPLWPHQREALKGLTAELSSAGRVTNVMACGTGKTRVGAETAQLVAPSDPVLVVLPTLDLITQTLAVWLETLGRQALGRIVVVCGDREILDRDMADDLSTLAIEVTSDVSRLVELLRDPHGRSTVAITYQSLPKLVAAHEFSGVRPWRLIVVDEAHRSAGLKNRQWSTIHDDALVPASRRLYMTATPRLVTLRNGDLSAIASMDDERVFGRVGYRLGFAAARRRRLLARYELVVSVVTDEEIHRLATGPDGAAFLELGRSAVSAPMLARQVAVLRAARQYNVHRMLAYHRQVQDARWFSQTLPKVDALLDPESTLTAGFVHGGQSRAQRRSELGKLSDSSLGRVIVSNARLLGEGYDAPEVGGVAFMAAKKSTVDIVQAVGRALRLGGKEDKTAYIFVPVVIGAGEDPVSALEGSAYGHLWQVVSALAAHDEDLAANLEARRHDLGRNSYDASRALMGTPDWLSFSGTAIPDGFAQAITVRTVRSMTTSWEEYVGAASAYAKEKGDLLVRTDFVTESGLTLGMWIRWARQAYGANELSPTRTAQLEALGMVWNVSDELFARNLAAAAAYRTEHGNLRIHTNYTTPEPNRIRLGNWICALRRRKEELTAQHRDALDELGMVWSPFEDDWRRGVDAARAHWERHGHLRVRSDHIEPLPDDPEGFALGEWLSRTRNRRKQLTPARVAELDALGMTWKVREDTWQRHFTAAQAFHARHGNLDIPRRHIETLPDGQVSLGEWLWRQQSAKAAGTLSPERTSALLDLGMKSDSAHDRAWDRGITFAQLYRERFGNLNVPTKHVISDDSGAEFRLGHWISEKRSHRLRGKLAQDRIAQLDTLGMIWDLREAKWRLHFEAAEEYCKSSGDLNIPIGYVTAPPDKIYLGSWIGRQRTDFRMRRLTANQINDLTRIGMQWT